MREGGDLLLDEERRREIDRNCVVNCDNLFTIPKQAVGHRRGELDPESVAHLRTALKLALDPDA